MIYTSYFAAVKNLPDNVYPISIALKSVDQWKYGVYPSLMPSYSILQSYKEGTSEEIYRERYYAEILSRLNPVDVLNDLFDQLPERMRFSLLKEGQSIDRSKTIHIALICYENPAKFCHRHLVAEWLSSYGILCQEYLTQKKQRMIYRLLV